jgi:putative SOS response-associated peptidase YedK
MLPSELLGMCGRSSLFIDQADLEARFDAEVVTDGGYTPRYNIAPVDDLHIITNETPDEIDAYHWGLIPFWADEPEESIINARSRLPTRNNSNNTSGMRPSRFDSSSMVASG